MRISSDSEKQIRKYKIISNSKAFQPLRGLIYGPVELKFWQHILDTRVFNLDCEDFFWSYIQLDYSRQLVVTFSEIFLIYSSLLLSFAAEIINLEIFCICLYLWLKRSCCTHYWLWWKFWLRSLVFYSSLWEGFSTLKLLVLLIVNYYWFIIY